MRKGTIGRIVVDNVASQALRNQRQLGHDSSQYKCFPQLLWRKVPVTNVPLLLLQEISLFHLLMHLVLHLLLQELLLR